MYNPTIIAPCLQEPWLTSVLSFLTPPLLNKFTLRSLQTHTWGTATVWLVDRWGPALSTPTSSNKNKPSNRLNLVTPLCQHTPEHTPPQNTLQFLLPQKRKWSSAVYWIQQSRTLANHWHWHRILEAVGQWSLNEICLILPMTTQITQMDKAKHATSLLDSKGFFCDKYRAFVTLTLFILNTKT